MSMMETYSAITQRDGNSSVIKGEIFTLLKDCANDYYAEILPVIPAGTEIVAEFAGDFGMYGVAEVGGALHKVKIKLHELHHVDFGRFDAREKEKKEA